MQPWLHRWSGCPQERTRQGHPASPAADTFLSIPVTTTHMTRLMAPSILNHRPMSQTKLLNKNHTMLKHHHEFSISDVIITWNSDILEYEAHYINMNQIVTWNQKHILWVSATKPTSWLFLSMRLSGMWPVRYIDQPMIGIRKLLVLLINLNGRPNWKRVYMSRKLWWFATYTAPSSAWGRFSKPSISVV